MGSDLWAQVDEDVANDDADYIWKNRLGWPFTLSHGTLKLSSPIGGWPTPGQVHTIKLRQGSTMIYQGSCPASPGYTDCSASFTTTQITNDNLLALELGIALAPATSGDQTQGRVAWARPEIN
jgi:hypothetical protein